MSTHEPSMKLARTALDCGIYGPGSKGCAPGEFMAGDVGKRNKSICGYEAEASVGITEPFEKLDYHNEFQSLPTPLASKLLQLPNELRLEIYAALFRPTIIHFGGRTACFTIREDPNSAANTLAILRTCRQIYSEAQYVWLNCVTFSFQFPTTLFDNLTVLPPTTVSQIRHILVSGHSLSFPGPGQNHWIDYRLPWLLKLLPALRLDTLTVRAIQDIPYAVCMVSELIEHGNGWKTLRYIARNWSTYKFVRYDQVEPRWHRPRPSPREEKIIHQRDGAQSGASVTTYCAVPVDVDNTAASTHHPGQPPKDEAPSSGAVAAPSEGEDESLSTAIMNGTELLIVAKRGRGADPFPQDDRLYMWREDIQEWAYGMTWAEIRPIIADMWSDDSDD